MLHEFDYGYTLLGCNRLFRIEQMGSEKDLQAVVQAIEARKRYIKRRVTINLHNQGRADTRRTNV